MISDPLLNSFVGAGCCRQYGPYWYPRRGARPSLFRQGQAPPAASRGRAPCARFVVNKVQIASALSRFPPVVCHSWRLHRVRGRAYRRGPTRCVRFHRTVDRIRSLYHRCSECLMRPSTVEDRQRFYVTEIPAAADSAANARAPRRRFGRRPR